MSDTYELRPTQISNKVLFILKRREDYNAKVHNKIGLSTGLYNSASFMDLMLNEIGIESNLEVAIDNNCIDRMVTKHRPTHCIIEAFWVVPQKFIILSKLHPKIKWIVRIHSDMPFMAGEGSSMDWVAGYSYFPNITIAPNSPRMVREMRWYLKGVHPHWTEEQINEKVVYLPNYYPIEYTEKPFNYEKYWIDIGCFGAVRPLKNHLGQAVAALEFANSLHKQLRFHINLGRIEGNGQPAMNNLLRMFEALGGTGHQMIGHAWTPHEGFLEICSSMDIGMQVSFSETFNIVGADIINCGVPLVSSDEIPWHDKRFIANPVDTQSMVKALHCAYRAPALNVKSHVKNLNKYNSETVRIWDRYFRH